MIFIFIAYSRSDRKTIVEEVSSHLKQQYKNKLKIWDYQDYQAISNKEFINNLNSTDIFILFVSKNSMTSENVKVEILKACELESKGKIKRILPLIIEDIHNYSYKFINLKNYGCKHVRNCQDALDAINICLDELLENE